MADIRSRKGFKIKGAGEREKMYDRILELKGEGLSYIQIGERMGYSRNSISHFVRQCEKRGFGVLEKKPMNSVKLADFYNTLFKDFDWKGCGLCGYDISKIRSQGFNGCSVYSLIVRLDYYEEIDDVGEVVEAFRGHLEKVLEYVDDLIDQMPNTDVVAKCDCEIGFMGGLEYSFICDGDNFESIRFLKNVYRRALEREKV